jgi:hypothetical protein
MNSCCNELCSVTITAASGATSHKGHRPYIEVTASQAPYANTIKNRLGTSTAATVCFWDTAGAAGALRSRIMADINYVQRTDISRDFA